MTNIKDILERVFGDLELCRMNFYSEIEGEVFSSAPQYCGTLTYFYVFTIEEGDEDSDRCFTADIWYSKSGMLMSPRLEFLAKEYKTEEDAINIKAYITRNIKGITKCDQ
jgi:hypothetical protein